MHRLASSFVLGYHGCSRATAEGLLSGNAFRVSRNSYDWLGDGIYFWEANPLRGLEFHREAQARRKKPDDDASVVGAVINLGYCLDLATSTAIEAIVSAYENLSRRLAAVGQPLPTNAAGADRVLRRLDREVINYLHAVREDQNLAPFDTVRGFFTEGEEAFPGAGIRKKTHIQIAVRNRDCIRGVFRVPEADMRPL